MVGKMTFAQRGDLRKKVYKGRRTGKYVVFNGSMSLAEVKAFANDVSQKLRAKGITGEMNFGFRSNLFRWKSGGFSEIGEQPRVWDPEDE